MSTTFTPRKIVLLSLMTLVNLFNYFDRYILVALLPAIQKEMLLSDTELGILGTAFIIVYFAVSPLFGYLGDRTHRFRLMGVGVGLWSLATAASGFAANYPRLLLARMGVGVGEASYVAVSPALMSDLFPKKLRGRVFSLFFMAIPVGSALGYLIGGLLEKSWGWRHALLIAGFPGLLLALCLFFLKDPPRGQFDDEEEKEENLKPLEIAKRLWKNRPYVFTVSGYIAYTFVVGGVSFWMPSYLLRFYHLELASANMMFGAVTVIAGFLGTVVGGAWADHRLKTDPHAYLKISAWSAFAGALVFALVLMSSDLWVTMGLIFVLEFFIFLSTSPVNAQLVNCVPSGYRSSANALCIFLIHLLGDAVSPSLIGAISDNSNLRTALILGPVGTLFAGVLWIWGAREKA